MTPDSVIMITDIMSVQLWYCVPLKSLTWDSSVRFEYHSLCYIFTHYVSVYLDMYCIFVVCFTLQLLVSVRYKSVLLVMRPASLASWEIIAMLVRKAEHSEKLLIVCGISLSLVVQFLSTCLKSSSKQNKMKMYGIMNKTGLE